MQQGALTARFAALLILAGATAGVPASAEVIYTNLGPGGSYNGNSGAPISGGFAIAQPFQASANFQFTEAQLALLQATGDATTVYLASNNGGVPGTMLDTLVQQSPASYAGGLISFLCTACPTLSAGNTYWIIATLGNGVVAWLSNNTGTDEALRNTSGSSTSGPWSNLSYPDGAFQVNGISIACGSGRSMPAGQWTMFSLPCVPTAPSTVASVFSSVTGTYDSQWVVWERDEAANRYLKLGLDSVLTQGNGYWFKSLDAAEFSTFGTSTATPVTNCAASTGGCFEIPLTKPADSNGLYSLAGHPFKDSVNWSDVRVVVNGGSGLTPSQAETAGKLSKTYWVWNGSSYSSFDDVTTGFVGQLQPTYGMWVKVLDPNLSSIKLQIPASAGQSGLAGVIKKVTLKPSEWYVRLIAEVPAEGLKDSGNVLGHLKDAKPGPDIHDLAELPPSFTPYLTVVFPGEYASDFHPVKAGADNWSFVVRTDSPARQVKLSWEVNGKAPANMSLKDVKTGKVIQHKVGSYTFAMGATERAFTWSVK